MDFEDQLTTAMRSSVDQLTPPVPGLVSGGVERGQRMRRTARRRAVAAVVAGLVLVAGVGYVATASLRDSTTEVQTADGATTCRSVVETGVLPEWARAGFSEAEPRMPHVMSDKGDMVAILFGQPLSAPPAKDHSNKILWVSQLPVDTSTPFTIDATLAGTNTRVRREVAPAPGPSTVDLPRPGCWHVKLRWGSHTDTIDLVYR